MLTSLVTLNWDRQHEVAYSYDALGRMISKDFLVPDCEESLARESRGYNLQGWTCHMGAEYNSNEIFNYCCPLKVSR